MDKLIATEEVAIDGLHLTSRRPCWWKGQKRKSLLGIWLYYHARLELHFAPALTTNMATSSRGCNPRRGSLGYLHVSLCPSSMIEQSVAYVHEPEKAHKGRSVLRFFRIKKLSVATSFRRDDEPLQNYFSVSCARFKLLHQRGERPCAVK